jgi:hypothetical protein
VGENPEGVVGFVGVDVGAGAARRGAGAGGAEPVAPRGA